MFRNVIPCRLKFLELFRNLPDEKGGNSISVHKNLALFWHCCFLEDFCGTWSWLHLLDFGNIYRQKFVSQTCFQCIEHILVMEVAIYWDLDNFMLFSSSTINALVSVCTSPVIEKLAGLNRAPLGFIFCEIPWEDEFFHNLSIISSLYTARIQY